MAMINLKEKPTISGAKVMLRPFETSDIEYMEECLKDLEVIKLTGSDMDYDRDLVVKWYSTRNEQVDRLDLAIVDLSDGGVIGEVVMNEYDDDKRSMNYRILIGPRGRNRGLGTEATQLILDYMFLNTDLRQITLNVYAFNPRALSVYEKAGFVTDYVEVGELEYEGERIDSINMVLRRGDWEVMRRREEY